MTQKIVTTLVDDLDGTEAHETVEFGLARATYEIDLSENHARELRDALGDYIAHARRLSGRRGGRHSTRASTAGSRPAGTTTADREQNRAIREWARRQGMTVSERGRIPAQVIEAYNTR